MTPPSELPGPHRGDGPSALVAVIGVILVTLLLCFCEWMYAKVTRLEDRLNIPHALGDWKHPKDCPLDKEDK